jgi:protein ImuA
MADAGSMPQPSSSSPSSSPVALDVLRRRIAGLERFSGAGGSPAGDAVPLGAPEIDAHLPWGGIPRAALHEIAYAAPLADGPVTNGPAAAGFAAALLGHLARAGGRSVVWCRRPARGFRPELYGAGLARLGLPPDRLILARAPDSQTMLWTMEECLRSRAVAAVLGEPDRADARARRRLQLAAEETGVTALLLMDDKAAALPGPTVTRWRVAGAPAAADTAWRVELLKCRGGGRPGDWTLEWRAKDDGNDDDDADDDTGDDTGDNTGEPGDGGDENGEPAGRFRVVSPLRDGPARRRAG